MVDIWMIFTMTYPFLIIILQSLKEQVPNYVMKLVLIFSIHLEIS